MVHVAKEMERQGFDMPLLIGGATTSKAHTAVKIEPQYEHGGGLRAGCLARGRRGLRVCCPRSSSPVSSPGCATSMRRCASSRAAKNQAKNNVSIERARANRTPIDWVEAAITAPTHPGLTVLADIDLAEIVPYIDWTFFFHAWELKGRFPKILDDPEKGEEARKLFADAQAMLRSIVEQKWLRAAAVVGLFPANAVGDDIEVYADDARLELRLTLHNLRKQGKQPAGKYNESLADFIAPKDSGGADYIGGFAVTAGLGIDDKLAEFEADHDDYQQHHAQGAGRPTGRGADRVAAREGAQGAVGLRRRRGARATRS